MSKHEQDARAIAAMTQIMLEHRAQGHGNASIRRVIHDRVRWAREPVRMGFFRTHLPIRGGQRQTRIKHEEG